MLIDVVDRDICIRVHVDDMLAVGSKDATRQELARDMEMSRGTKKTQEYLGQSLSRTTGGFIFSVAEEFVKQLCTDFGYRELKGANNLVFEQSPR